MQASRHLASLGVRPLRMALPAIAAFFVCSMSTLPASAADDAVAAKKDEIKLPEPEDLSLTTGDGLNLAVTYYPGTKGKQTIPIVLLHMWKQSRNDYKDLAPALQKLGHAVIVPDLRGHGESKHHKDARREEKLDAATMLAPQFGQMVAQDMKAIKVFLWEQNNEGRLNIDKLCIVGAEMGASVALDFAGADALDQENNPVPRPEYQLGRFVKALVLISPELSFKGLPIRDAASNPVVQRDIAMLILVGKEDGKSLQDAKRINGLFDRYHLEPTGDTVTERNDKRTLFFVKLDTSLQGTKLLDPKFDVESLIADFIHRRLIKSEESRAWAWKERKIPHE